MKFESILAVWRGPGTPWGGLGQPGAPKGLKSFICTEKGAPNGSLWAALGRLLGYIYIYIYMGK